MNTSRAILLIALLPLNLYAAEFQTGVFRISSTTMDLLGEAGAKSFESVVDSDQEFEWSLYVPENYDPKSPAGVFVGTEYFPAGRIPIQWTSVMDDHNIIWVSPTNTRRSNNSVSIALSFLSTMVIARNYKVDRNRIYFLGVGDVASYVAIEYPELFRGVIFNLHTNTLGKVPAKKLRHMRSNNYAFWSARDYFDNPMQMKRARNSFADAGIENTKYWEILEVNQLVPNDAIFSETIEFLESRNQ